MFDFDNFHQLSIVLSELKVHPHKDIFKCKEIHNLVLVRFMDTHVGYPHTGEVKIRTVFVICTGKLEANMLHIRANIQ